MSAIHFIIEPFNWVNKVDDYFENPYAQRWKCYNKLLLQKEIILAELINSIIKVLKIWWEKLKYANKVAPSDDIRLKHYDNVMEMGGRGGVHVSEKTI